MDGSRFDRLTKSIAEGTSRRSLLKAAAAGILANALPMVGGRARAATAKRKIDEICRKNADCASNLCGQASSTGRRRCGCQTGSDCPLPGVCRVSATCSNGACAYAVAPDGTSCGPGKNCQSGVCARSYCVIDAISYNPGTVYEFNPCLACRPTISVNSWSPLPDSTACSSGNLCKSNETCASGVCGGGNSVICEPMDNCHLTGICNPQTGVCSNPTKENDTSCTDQNLCTQTDTCQEGVCTGANPVDCAPPDQCHQQGICNQATGLCEYEPVADQTECTLADQCMLNTRCIAGICTGTPKDCDDSNACTGDDTCDPSSGNCLNPPIVCPTSLNPCLTAVCDPETGCDFAAVADGVPCDDGSDATCESTCQAGVCTETEIDFTTDINNCGTCGNVCSEPHATSICVNGEYCIIESCEEGWADCTQTGGGCIDELATSVTFCGSCSNDCTQFYSNPTCNAGVCEGECLDGLTECGAAGCVDLNTDLLNCGACGTDCSEVNSDPVCTEGVCEGNCYNGLSYCDGSGCVDFSSDTGNCGSCGNVCSTNNVLGTICSEGVCSGTCAAGFADCNNNMASDGCEININTSYANCGSCGHSCSGSQTCSNGICIGCFVAGTRIAMADGTSRSIELIAIGDLVLGADGQINEVEEIMLPLLHGQKLYAFNKGDFFVTASHPFMTEAGWKALDPVLAAKDHPGVAKGRIEVGDQLRVLAGVAVVAGRAGATAGDQTDVKIESLDVTHIQSIEADPGTQLYNLRLSGNHTYFANELLVHNKP